MCSNYFFNGNYSLFPFSFCPVSVLLPTSCVIELTGKKKKKKTNIHLKSFMKIKCRLE